MINSLELDKAVNTITESSIKLAEATSDYGALKVIFGVFTVFIILLIIMFIYDKITYNRKLDSIYSAAINTDEYFKGVGDKSIGSNEANILLRRSFNTMSHIIKYLILRIRLENHIDNKEATEDKINKVVMNEYTELNSFLSNFICQGQPLNTILEVQDVEIIKNLVLEQVYHPDFNISLMDQAVNICMNGLKLTYINKL